MLKLDFTASGAASTILSTSSAITLAGGTFGSTLLANGASAGSTQSLANITLNAGASAITATGSITLNLGTITRNSGSVVNFTLPTTGNITTTRSNANFTGGQQTILGGFATVGGNTWAVSGTGGSAGAITGLATASYGTTYAAGADVDSPTSATVSSMTINSLRLNAAAATTVSFTGPLTIATGGILVTSAVGATGTLSGSTVTSGNGQDLIVINNSTTNRNLVISSQITGNIGLTFNGGLGQLQLNTLANYTGNTVVNSGRFGVNVSGSTNNVPASSLIIVNGSALGGGECYENASVTTLSNNLQLSGLGWAETGGSYRRCAAKVALSPATSRSSATRIGGNNNYAVSGAVSGPYELELDAGTNSSSTGNIITFTSASNTWSGGTRISRGTAKLGVDNALPLNSVVTFGSTVTSGTLSVIGTAVPILDLAGFNQTVGGLTVQSSDAIAAAGANITNSGASKTLTINNGPDFTFGGTITGSLALTKNGSGRQTLAGSNAYTGATNINAGVLSVTGSTASVGAMNVNTSGASSGTLAGTGSIGAVTLAADNGADQPTSPPAPRPPRGRSARWR